MNLYQAKEKIIYKFISSRLQFYHDKEQRLILNSANLLIPHANFPISMMNICLLFNSNFMNWLFNKIFNTHKVLRGDIECLPIHNQFINNIFSEDLYLSKLNLERKNGTYRFKK